MSPEAKPTPVIFSSRRPGGLRRWRGPYPLLLSLGLGLLVWAYVDSRRMVIEEFAVPLEVQIPPGWQMLIPPNDMIKVRVRGARQIMRSIRRDRLYILQKIKLPKEELDSFSVQIVLDAGQVEGLPRDVVILGLAPSAFPLKLVRLVKRWVPVKASIVGKPDKGFTVGLIQVDPKGVEVMAPKYVIDLLTPSDVIKTRPINITGKRYGAADRVQLEPLVKNGVSIKAAGSVYVSIELKEAPLERRLDEKIPVRMLMGWPLEKMLQGTLTPPVVQVTVSGPELLVAKLTASDITVYVDTRETAPTGEGGFSMKCHALVPEKIEVVRIEPGTVQWRSAQVKPATTKTATGTEQSKHGAKK